ncbi:hypothetical protein BAUCODRAFT_247090 [Baudoinia panamericana UAMH 10762]|uniref:Uncharacterized protein n=1 Tax=Baudoinia panamericana (strain UAMH 10762) TaxID=717646 RepID=M2N4H4_BAUPA|nr:uncharacterized protein BAUCODRAFT_247090 [Baudoinia panamericana UAMH 10762]EMC93610.1 hypothetical protein BAUCODRAFT_247090 [Baudoinia panamericana UAMH 10762]
MHCASSWNDELQLVLARNEAVKLDLHLRLLMPSLNLALTARCILAATLARSTSASLRITGFLRPAKPCGEESPPALLSHKVQHFCYRYVMNHASRILDSSWAARV